MSEEQRPDATTGASAAAPARGLGAYVGIAARGVCMGAADVVPGVSGGTMAFILGIYEELIDSIRTVGHRKFLGPLLKLRFGEALGALNWRFLAALGSGIVVALVSLAKVIVWLLAQHPELLWSFFFGLVLASIFVVSRRIKRWNAPLGISMLAGAVGAYLFVGLVPVQTPEAWWFLVVSGAVASCAMILPGVSGAFLLVLLGKYQFVLAAVKGFDLATIFWVGCGAAIGLVTFSQVLGWLFHRYHDIVVALLTGLMLGSLRKIWPWKEATEFLRDASGEILMVSHQAVPLDQHNVLPGVGSGADALQLGLAVGLAVLGCGAIVLLEKVANARQRRAA